MRRAARSRQQATRRWLGPLASADPSALRCNGASESVCVCACARARARVSLSVSVRVRVCLCLCLCVQSESESVRTLPPLRAAGASSLEHDAKRHESYEAVCMQDGRGRGARSAKRLPAPAQRRRIAWCAAASVVAGALAPAGRERALVLVAVALCPQLATLVSAPAPPSASAPAPSTRFSRRHIAACADSRTREGAVTLHSTMENTLHAHLNTKKAHNGDDVR